ncbi:hypothetical protein GF362_00545 [Candidatus Dojkabacteria bacterium]|nr:hypothetical protein [Candidatus Dojkabacteria bacterium]
MKADEIFEIINFSKENIYFLLTSLLGLAILVYTVIIFWLISDIQKRIKHKVLRYTFYGIILSTILSGILGYIYFNPIAIFITFGIFLFLIIYLIFRPKEIIDVNHNQLYNKNDVILFEPNLVHCKKCHFLNKKSYRFCTNCGRNLKFQCQQCNYEIDPIWHFCPNCQGRLDHVKVYYFWQKLIAFPSNIFSGFWTFISEILKKLRKKIKIQFDFETTTIAVQKHRVKTYELKSEPSNLTLQKRKEDKPKSDQINLSDAKNKKKKKK